MRSLSLALFLIFPAFALAVGDTWTATRGDNSPGASYTAFVETPSGRWLAAGSGGQLMLSDDAGATWRYQVIRDGSGRALFGFIGNLIVDGNSIVGTVVDLVPSSVAPFEGRTRIISSSNNGDSWNVEAFPVTAALLGGREYRGVYLPKLFRAPTGEVVAYGSTVVSNIANTYFIGGAIFRRTGSSWQQVYFGLGSIESIAQTGNRLTAAGFQSMLDSPDGISWNGYRFLDAQMIVDGELLDTESRAALFASDVSYINDNYVIHTIRFRRSSANPAIFEAVNTGVFTFASPNPFDGGRIWNGTGQNRAYGGWLRSGDNLVSVFNGAATSGDALSWTTRDSTVRVFSGSYGSVGPQQVVAVGNSDEVWQSNNAGETWNKILDSDPGPDLRNLTRVGDRLLAVADQNIWSSVDNGLTWIELADLAEQTGRAGAGRLRSVDGQRVFTVQGGQLATSADGGANWQALALPSLSGVQDVVIGRSGRLVLAPESRSIGGEPTPFYTSDDGGQTWDARLVDGLGFGATPKRGLYVGNGRIIYMINSSISSFDPRLIVSDDNGTSWRVEDPFQTMDRLTRPINDPETRVVELARLFQSSTGRLFILGGQGEILTSDNLGDSWSVPVHNNLDQEEDEPFLAWRVWDIAEANGRIVVVGSRRIAGSTSSNARPNALISEDDGNTWREVLIPTENAGLFHATAGRDGRVVLAGNRGAVYVSDPAALPIDGRSPLKVREGEVLDIEIPRPPLEGDLNVTYVANGGTAQEGSDYVALAGTLQWLAGDDTPRTISLTTIDDVPREGPETLQIDVVSDGDPVISQAFLIEIENNEGSGRAVVDFFATEPLVTNEAGEPLTFGVSLGRPPNQQNVVVTLRNENPEEITAGPTTFTFTPDNWNQLQTVTVPGGADSERDRDVSAQLIFTPSRDDPTYAEAPSLTVYVVNQDDELDEVILADGFEG